jgi:hypothetical protein
MKLRLIGQIRISAANWPWDDCTYRKSAANVEMVNPSAAIGCAKRYREPVNALRFSMTRQIEEGRPGFNAHALNASPIR